MEGSTCGDHAVAVYRSSDDDDEEEEEEEELCYEGLRKQLKLHRGDRVGLSLWRANSSSAGEFSLECHLWCDEAGELGRRGGEGRGEEEAEAEAEAELLQSLVKTFHFPTHFTVATFYVHCTAR